MEAYNIEPLKIGQDIVYKSKNDLGQIISMTFEYEGYSSLIYWNVVLWIGKNYKGYEYKNQTGRDGLKSLLWAKKCLIDFMDKIEIDGRTQHILIGWDTTSRKKAYYRGLYDLGFRFARIERGIWLHKTIIK
jgi:hypothetical protein